MSSDLAISVRGLGKSYTIRHNRASAHTTLAEAIVDRIKHPLRRRSGSSETFWALKDVSFDVKAGEVVGIIGRNGAGKSTLLKILSRITEPTAGEIDLFGRVGSLLEVGTGFHQELTGRENIFLNGAILGMTRNEIKKQFDAIVDFSGVEQFLDTPVKRYSSGMYVRLAFAVAAHLRSEILVVDEVLAVGDAEFQRKCLGKMKDVATDGRTVLFVSHNMQSVSLLCSRAAYLEEGWLRFAGAVQSAIDHYQRSFARESAHRPLGQHGQRRGTGEYRFAWARPDKPHFTPDEPKVIRFRLERKTGPLASMFFQAFIVDVLGTVVSQTDSRLVNHRLEDADGYECTVVLKTPWLKPGEYRVDLLVVGGAIVDAFDDACRLQVSPVLPYPQSAPGDAIDRCPVLSEFTWSSQVVPIGASGEPPVDQRAPSPDLEHELPAAQAEQFAGATIGRSREPNPVSRLVRGKLISACDFVRHASSRAGRGERPRIGYMGGTGGGDEAGNLGDGVMYGAAADLLPQFDLLAFHHPRHEARLAWLRLGGTRYFDSVLLGGGTLINPPWAPLVAMALRQGLRISALGTGVGSWGLGQPEQVDISEWAPLLRRFDRIGVRGPLSKQKLQAIGIGCADVVGDLALSLTRDHVVEPADRPMFALNMVQGMDQRGRPGARWIDGVTRALRRLVDDRWGVVAVAMHPEDVTETRRCAEAIAGRRIEVSLPRTPEEFFRLVGPCRFTVSVRLHGGILSAACGVPPLLLGYRDKHLDFVQTMGDSCAHVRVSEDNADEVQTVVDSLAASGPARREDVHGRALHWRAVLTDYARQCAAGSTRPSVPPDAPVVRTSVVPTEARGPA